MSERRNDQGEAMMDTGDILAAARARAIELSDEDLAQFGRTLFFFGACLIGCTEGAEALSRTAHGVSVTATSAMREGEQDG